MVQITSFQQLEALFTKSSLHVKEVWTQNVDRYGLGEDFTICFFNDLADSLYRWLEESESVDYQAVFGAIDCLLIYGHPEFREYCVTCFLDRLEFAEFSYDRRSKPFRRFCSPTTLWWINQHEQWRFDYDVDFSESVELNSMEEYVASGGRQWLL